MKFCARKKLILVAKHLKYFESYLSMIYRRIIFTENRIGCFKKYLIAKLMLNNVESFQKPS